MDAVAKLNAVLAGRYVIEREIGRGGMATVYLARDLRHDRHVALKLLDPELGAVLGVERFLAEIRVTANLQHPNLLPLFDSGEADGLLFYVMPFVDGESLRARLERERQLRIDDAVHIATAVAGALGYAHSRGVIHRDLKPENILIHAGEPLVADFGIALAVSRAGGPRVTQTGLSLGTPQYMSPEQATSDRVIDHRSDIYSLGVVTYEMLTGEPPHTGRSVQAVIARVVTEPPRDVRLARPTVPAHVAAAVTTALEKLPADRWSTAHEFAEALRGRLTAGVAGARGRPDAGRARWRDPVMLALAAAGAGGLGLAGWTAAHPAVSGSGPVAFSFALAPGERVAWNGAAMIAITPDARTTVFSSRAPNGATRFLVRRLSDLLPREIPGTVGARAPFFSADGRHLLYSVDGKLIRSDLDGGERTEIASVTQIWRGSAVGDRMVLSASQGQGSFLATVPASGGEVSIISRADTAHGEVAQKWPLLLPDARTIVYASHRKGQEPTLTLMSFDGSAKRPLSLSGEYPLGYLEGHLVYVRTDGVVAAAPLDIQRAKVTGRPVAIGDTAGVYGGGMAVAALAANGALVYESPQANLQLTLVDATGGSRAITAEHRRFSFPRFSPDGGRVLVAIDQDLWTYDVAASHFTRLTRDSTAVFGEWAPNGRRIYYTGGPDTGRGIWSVAADGSGSPEPVVVDGRYHAFTRSPGGRGLAYKSASSVVLRSFGDSATTTLPSNDGGELEFQFSPDGRLFAYSSRKSGPLQVYVRPAGSASPLVQVSGETAGEPRWSPDGAYLYFRDGEHFWRARIVTSPSLAARPPERLFADAYDWNQLGAAYDVSPDGTRFLMLEIPATEMQVRMVLNWMERLRGQMRRR